MQDRKVVKKMQCYRTDSCTRSYLVRVQFLISVTIYPICLRSRIKLNLVSAIFKDGHVRCYLAVHDHELCSSISPLKVNILSTYSQIYRLKQEAKLVILLHYLLINGTNFSIQSNINLLHLRTQNYFKKFIRNR